MIRAFENETRIATAVILKDGGILQVYPTKERVVDEETWRAKWQKEGVTFKAEEKEKAQRLSRAEKVARQRVGIYLSVPNPTDTAMQALIRKVYNQESIRDSIRSTAKTVQDAYYGARLDPGLYVMLPENGHIVPVFFNRKSGLVLFGNKDETQGCTDGLKFYRKNYGNELLPIQLLTDQQGPDQKAVVICNNRWGYDTMYHSLRKAGFFIYTYHYKWRPSVDDIQEMYRVVPHCQGIVWDWWNENLHYFDLTSADTWRCKNANLKKWIEERQ